ncbi:MAG: hypothetical protein OSB55_07020 [Verrucomicrobiota bacterium]|nr:hypothetical protein [Verrucomicrobiota bacterium]
MALSFFSPAGGEITFFPALVSLAVGFFPAFLGGVFLDGDLEAGLTVCLATGFLVGAFFFVVAFEAVFSGDTFLAAGLVGAFFFVVALEAVFFGDAFLAAGFLTTLLTGFLDGGFAVFFFAPVALDCAGFLAFLAGAFFVAVFLTTFFLVCAFAIPLTSIR